MEPSTTAGVRGAGSAKQVIRLQAKKTRCRNTLTTGAAVSEPPKYP